MKFSDGEREYECTSAGDWCEWVQTKFDEGGPVFDCIADGFDEIHPIKIGYAEYSAYSVLEKIDPLYLSQCMDSEIESLADSIQYWMESDGYYRFGGGYEITRLDDEEGNEEESR